MVTIVRDFRIHSVKGSRISNAPFELVLDQLGNVGYSPEERSETQMTLDETTCQEHQLPISLDLVGRKIRCTFTSRNLKTEANDQSEDNIDFGAFVDFSEFGSKALRINSIKKTEETHIDLGRRPTNKSVKANYVLKAASFGGGGRMSPVPCPFYRFVVYLTEEEYNSLEGLTSSSVFELGLELIPVETVEIGSGVLARREENEEEKKVMVASGEKFTFCLVDPESKTQVSLNGPNHVHGRLFAKVNLDEETIELGVGSLYIKDNQLIIYKWDREEGRGLQPERLEDNFGNKVSLYFEEK